jgi:hypothetical protein
MAVYGGITIVNEVINQLVTGPHLGMLKLEVTLLEKIGLSWDGFPENHRSEKKR